MSVEKEPISIEVKAVTEHVMDGIWHGYGFDTLGQIPRESRPYISISVSVKNQGEVINVTEALKKLGIGDRHIGDIPNYSVQNRGMKEIVPNVIDVDVFDVEKAGQVIRALSEKYPNIKMNPDSIALAYRQLARANQEISAKNTEQSQVRG